MELTGNSYRRRDWRKLLSTRRGTVMVALGCTIVAGGILAFAMARYRSSVAANGNPITVLVAAQPIPKNTPGDVLASENLFKATQVVASQATSGAIADTAALHGKVAVRNINPGEQLTAADFTANGGLPAQLGPTQRAMTVTLNTAHGMIGQLQTGDRVDVYGGYNFDSGNGRSVPVLRLLMSDIEVLTPGVAGGTGSGIGGGGSSASNSTGNVTLNVTPTEAAALAYTADNGQVWLVLRPATASTTTPPSTVTAQALLFASKPISGGGKH